MIRTLREKKGFTHEELAKNPSLDVVRRLARVLGVRLSELLG